MPEQGTCRTCKAKVLWVEMVATGKKDPLDAEPCDKGNVHINEAGEGTILSRELIAKMRERIPGAKLYLSHFATCPQSREHRKPA